jgi:hypothetical protein
MAPLLITMVRLPDRWCLLHACWAAEPGEHAATRGNFRWTEDRRTVIVPKRKSCNEGGQSRVFGIRSHLNAGWRRSSQGSFQARVRTGRAGYFSEAGPWGDGCMNGGSLPRVRCSGAGRMQTQDAGRRMQDAAGEYLLTSVYVL